MHSGLYCTVLQSFDPFSILSYLRECIEEMAFNGEKFTIHKFIHFILEECVVKKCISPISPRRPNPLGKLTRMKECNAFYGISMFTINQPFIENRKAMHFTSVASPNPWTKF